MLVESGGRFFARWSRDDGVMRSRNRGVLESPDSMDSVDDAFLLALRSDDGLVRWDSADDLRDLGHRLDAWRFGGDGDSSVNAQVGFRLVAVSYTHLTLPTN